MRLGVVSDIHGNLPALEAVAAELHALGVDAVVNLGDSLSGPLLPRETARYLMDRDWIHLAGNHERQILDAHAGSSASDTYARSQLGAEALAWIASLPHTRRFERDVLLCHGSPGSDVTPLLQVGDRAATAAQVAQRLGDTDAALVLCGHSHVPRMVRHAGCLIVNPGSVGQPAYADDHPFDHVIESGSPDARFALLERRGGQWHASLRMVAYDHRRMADLAASRGRADWARALATGYVS